MAKTGITFGLLIGCVFAFLSHPFAAMTRVSANAMPQVSAPLSASASERLRDEIKSLEQILPGASDRGAVLFLLAHDYARLGQPAKALMSLQQCVALNAGFNPAADSAFSSLHGSPEFRILVERAQRQNPPVRSARVAFTVAQNDLFPEGLAVDASKRIFYMGSEYHNKIVGISEAGKVADFVKQDVYDLMPVGGVHVDPTDHSVWCATDPGKKNRSEIVHFDAEGKLLERYMPSTPGPHVLNDLVLHGSREIYLTDTEGNHVFRFDRQSHRFSKLDLKRPLFEPNGITVSDDGNALYVGDDLGVIRMDLRTNDAYDLKPLANDTMAGIDGLYWYPLHRRLRRLRFLHRRSDCFRVERTQFPGGAFTRSRPAPFHGARVIGIYRDTQLLRNNSELRLGGKTMQRWKVVRIAASCIGIAFMFSIAWPASAQNDKATYPSMAPLDQYMMPDRDSEIALARSAAPESISHDAEVRVLGHNGYETAIRGKNGFVCIVERSWAAPIDDPDFWNPKLRSPNCFNAAAARSYLPRIIKKTELILAGRSKTQMMEAIVTAIDKKELSAMEPGAMCYMLSKQGYVSERDGHWHPHLMFFFSQIDPAAWGASLTGSPIFAFNDT